MPQHSEETLLLQVQDLALMREIVVHNDDVNTFEHVIECLMKYCGHEPIQAEQCAWIVHHNGKCSVKRGTYIELEPRCTALQECGLSAEIA